jgi:hypothetical protein
LFKRRGQQLVGTTRLSDSGRVVVREDNAGGIVAQHRFHHLARIHTRLGQGAPKQFLASNESVLRVQEQYDKDFVLSIGNAETQIFSDSGRVSKHHIAVLQPIFDDAQGPLNRGIIGCDAFPASSRYLSFSRIRA